MLKKLMFVFLALAMSVIVITAAAVLATPVPLGTLSASSADPAGVHRAGKKSKKEAKARAASAAWDDAFNAGDVRRLMKLYTKDAVSMPPNLPALEGKAAIQADFEWFLGEFDADHRTTIVGLQIAGDWAIERGQYTMVATSKDGKVSFFESGRHIVVRKKSGKSWLVVWEIWNSDS